MLGRHVAVPEERCCLKADLQIRKGDNPPVQENTLAGRLDLREKTRNEEIWRRQSLGIRRAVVGGSSQ